MACGECLEELGTFATGEELQDALEGHTCSADALEAVSHLQRQGPDDGEPRPPFKLSVESTPWKERGPFSHAGEFGPYPRADGKTEASGVVSLKDVVDHVIALDRQVGILSLVVDEAGVGIVVAEKLREALGDKVTGRRVSRYDREAVKVPE
mgnify:CR=1 FL=1